MLLDRKYIIRSFLFHLMLLIIASLLNIHSNSIKKTFVVFGAHTNKPHHATYKSFKSHAIPFVSRGTRRGGRVKKLGNSKKSNNGISKKTARKQGGKQVIKNQIHKKAHQKTITEQQKDVSKITAKKVQKTLKAPGKNSHAHPQEKKLLEPAAVKENPKKELAKIPEKVRNNPEPHEEKTSPEDITTSPATKEQQISVAESKEIQEAEDAPSNEDEIVDIDFAAEDYDLGEVHVYKKEIQHEVDRLWRSPVGVPKATTCCIQFTIKQDGSVSCLYAQRSSILIYDLSVMRAAKNISFPKALWGKQIKIAFHQ